MTSNKRTRKAATIAETAAGLFIIIPVFLLLADVIAVLIAQTQNDSLAKQAARAASEKDEKVPARTAADQVITNFGSTSLVSNPTITMFRYNKDGTEPPAPLGGLYVQTSVRCNLPVPVPFSQLDHVDLAAEATETTVALPP